MNYQIYMNQKKLLKYEESILDEYAKRLSAYCKIQRFPNSQLQPADFISRHSGSSHTLFFQVCPGIVTPTSEEFAAYMNEIRIKGISSVCFFLGYEEPAKETSEIPVLSLTSFRLSVGMTGILLCEQLYRSYRILNHQPYHK